MNKYYIGLDIGSESVGWAVTDGEYNLIRLKGKTAWGSRLFSQASDAKTRRAFRSAKRRTARRKYRIHLINELFAEELQKIDNSFLLRLEESNLLLEEKKHKYPFYLLGSKTLDRAYFKNYPTIWHLRSALVSGDPDAYKDIRYVYLAIHHIIKYRGNFLLDGKLSQTFDENNFVELNSALEEILKENQDDFEESFELFPEESYQSIISILKDDNFNTSDRKKRIKELAKTNPDLSTYIDMFITLISGGSFASTKIFKDEEKIDIRFDSSFDANEDKIKALFGTHYRIIELAKSLYDYIYLNRLIGSNKYISDAFKTIYDTHHKQLHLLKGIIKSIDEKNGKKTTDNDSLFYEIFRDDKNDKNYCAFVHDNKSSAKRPSIHDFNKYIYDILSKEKEQFSNNDDFEYLLNLASKDRLLQIIANVSNSTIPHQLHEIELEIILQNAIKYYPSLKDSVDKIISIFKFRVPYFYGPLDNRSKYSNIVRKSNEKVKPWNIDEIIDKDETKKRFMGNLTNECTMLGGENVLPACSIMYMDYIIFDRLNKITINGDLITQEIKMDLFENLISKKQKTTINNIKKYLKSKYTIYRTDDVAISGINENDTFNATNRYLLAKVFDIDGKDYEMVEEILLALTIYTDNKNDAIEYIKKNHKISIEQEKVLRSLNCKGWGAFSRKFLTLRSADNNGEMHSSIMELLKNTTMNLNQILYSEKYNFLERINELNREFFGLRSPKKVANDLIENTPPLMRRSVIQAMRIVEEVKKITKQAPQKIFVEVTRENDIKNKGKTKDSRKEELAHFLNSLIKDKDVYSENAKSALTELDSIGLEKLRGKHLYLYFKQMGLDLYTGERIDINDVFDSNKYDVDHIVPQSLIKDDSIDNLALVKREINQKVKKDIYPLPEQIRCNPQVIALWSFLKKKGAISDKKYNALMRKTTLTDAELEDFINRQINVVSHSNKVVKDVFNVLYPNTQVVFSKAQYPSHIRKELDIPKVRDLNDTHHAVDAYLNVVAGDILSTKFGDMRLIKARSNNERISFNMENELNRKLIKTELGQKVTDNCFRHDFLLTYKNTYQDDAFYKQTIYKNTEKNLIPIHTSFDMNPNKYGGYSSLSTKYLATAAITNSKKSSSERVLVRIPALYMALAKNNEELQEMIIKQVGLKTNETMHIDFSNLISNNQKVYINGCYYLLCSNNESTVSLKPFSPIYLQNNAYRYLKTIEKYKDDCKDCLENEIIIHTDKNESKEVVISKESNQELLQELINIASLKKYDYCTLITRIKEYDSEEFNKKTIFEQIDEIENLVLLFNRTQIASKYAPALFRKSMGSILKDNVYIIDDSVTGLYSRKIKL